MCTRERCMAQSACHTHTPHTHTHTHTHKHTYTHAHTRTEPPLPSVLLHKRSCTPPASARLCGATAAAAWRRCHPRPKAPEEKGGEVRDVCLRVCLCVSVCVWVCQCVSGCVCVCLGVWVCFCIHGISYAGVNTPLTRPPPPSTKAVPAPSVRV